jgi:hypothetical protein
MRELKEEIKGVSIKPDLHSCKKDFCEKALFLIQLA